jgi:hypothetical protein
LAPAQQADLLNLIAAVPEPGQYGVLGLGGMMVLMRWRRNFIAGS